MDPDWIRIRIGVHPKMLDPDPDEMNADPQPWLTDFAALCLTDLIDWRYTFTHGWYFRPRL